MLVNIHRLLFRMVDMMYGETFTIIVYMTVRMVMGYIDRSILVVVNHMMMRFAAVAVLVSVGMRSAIVISDM